MENDIPTKLAQLASIDVYPFPVGQVVNPFDRKLLRGRPAPVFTQVTTRQPARLEAMLLDFSRLKAAPQPYLCTAGAIIFAADIYTVVTVRLLGESGEIKVTGSASRPSLIRHAAALMQAALGVSEGLTIAVEAVVEPLHVGLGTSGGLLAAVASAINYLYGEPVAPDDLVRYLVANYGEEIDGDADQLIPVVGVGGAVGAGLLGGGMMIIAGEATRVARVPLPNNYRFVIGVPNFFKEQSSFAWLNDFLAIDQMVQIDQQVPRMIAYQVLHTILPAMMRGDFASIGKNLWQLRCNEQNLDRFDSRYPGLKETILRLHRKLVGEKRVDLLLISSAGPAIFAVTQEKNLAEVVKVFRRHDMGASIVKPNNVGVTYHNLGQNSGSLPKR